MGPGDLSGLLSGVELPVNENVLVGIETFDDAGVYRLGDDIALVQTVDFFTPIVDDPFDFGRIAAANSLSDIYAMGGVPITALNILGFPKGTLDAGVAREIIRGGAERLRAAGAVLMGGHTVDDSELKYGLSVAGLVHPDRIIANGGARPGDILVLTKPLGTGIIATALKAELASDEALRVSIASMVELNAAAGEMARRFGLRGGTDVTGFGFIGHLHEVLRASRAGARVTVADVPVFSHALEYAAMGLMPCGLHNNRKWYGGDVDVRSAAAQERIDALFDPQTSGGLLLCVPPASRDAFMAQLLPLCAAAAVVGEVVEGSPGTVTLV